MRKYLLYDKMREHGDERADLAKAIGIAISTLSSKVNEHQQFTQSEIATITERYKLSAEDVVAIFFS